MSQTKAGAIKTRQTNLRKYGKGFYQRIGALGGKASNTGGFYNNHDRAVAAGKIGGTISRRGKANKTVVAESMPTPKGWFNNIKRLFHGIK